VTDRIRRYASGNEGGPETQRGRPIWFVGIDVSKATLDAAALSESGEIRRTKADNTAQGHAELVRWFQEFPDALIALEATSAYHRTLVASPQNAKLRVSVLNPAQASHLVKSPHRRNKTDKADALWLAVDANEHRPAPSLPASHLAHSLTRELEPLDKDLTRLKNRLEATEAGEAHPETLPSLRRHIEMLEHEKKALEEQLERDTKHTRGHELALLTSIPGIHTRTACHLLTELGDVHRLASARKLVAFAGLTPPRFDSGTSVGGQTKNSRSGSSALRRMLHMPCLAAIRINPVIKAFHEKPVKRNKPRKAAVITRMARLLKTAHGVLTSTTPFATNPTPA
jgi:transposase